jgi:uroporphyrinogen-III synthase
MSPQHPLRGKRFLVTRPEGQATALVHGIQALGGNVQHIPLLAIKPVDDLSGLKKMANELTGYRACIFISANAVKAAWPILSAANPAGWPTTVAAAAVGPGTAAVLRAYGVAQVVQPERQYDSEGLLSEPFFAEMSCHGQAFALIRGEGGRDFLAQSLRARGARVDDVAVYRRQPHPEALQRLQTWLDAGSETGMLLISSSESLQGIVSTASADLVASLQTLPVLAPHPRIAESARQMGFLHVTVCDGGDAGLLRYLQTYNETKLA